MDRDKEMFQRLIYGLQEAYGDNLVSIILYGSFARGTNTKESDIDIAVLMKGVPSKEMKDLATEKIVDLELEYNQVLSVIRIDQNIFLEWEDTLPFYKNVKEEGVVLWRAA